VKIFEIFFVDNFSMKFLPIFTPIDSLTKPLTANEHAAEGEPTTPLFSTAAPTDK